MKGFGETDLTKEEWLILSCFRGRESVAFPLDCGLDMTQTLTVLRNLTRKNIVRSRGPYYLTKLGRRLLVEVNNREL